MTIHAMVLASAARTVKTQKFRISVAFVVSKTESLGRLLTRHDDDDDRMKRVLGSFLLFKQCCCESVFFSVSNR